jgi:hypothetical protein
MYIKTINIHKDAKGFAHLGLILLVLGVVSVGGFAYWRVSSYNNNSDATGREVNNDSGSGATNTATISDECVEQTGDEVICRFGAISSLDNYASEVKMTMEGQTYTLTFDGKGNNTVDLGQDIKGITLGGKTYVYMMGNWYDASGDTTQAPKANMPSLGFATTAGITYENKGKEPCGTDTCYNYHMSGGILGDGVVTALIGDEDYLPRSIVSTGGLLGNLTMTVVYKDVTITAPEGVKPISSLGADLME